MFVNVICEKMANRKTRNLRKVAVFYTHAHIHTYGPLKTKIKNWCNQNGRDEACCFVAPFIM